MKSTGIVRKVDELGRIVLPKELRCTLDIEEKDSLEIYIDGDCIVLKKYVRGCTFCGSMSDLLSLGSKSICHKCAEDIEHLMSEKAR